MGSQPIDWGKILKTAWENGLDHLECLPRECEARWMLLLINSKPEWREARARVWMTRERPVTAQQRRDYTVRQQQASNCCRRPVRATDGQQQASKRCRRGPERAQVPDFLSSTSVSCPELYGPLPQLSSPRANLVDFYFAVCVWMPEKPVNSEAFSWLSFCKYRKIWLLTQATWTPGSKVLACWSTIYGISVAVFFSSWTRGLILPKSICLSPPIIMSIFIVTNFWP